MESTSYSAWWPECPSQQEAREVESQQPFRRLLFLLGLSLFAWLMATVVPSAAFSAPAPGWVSLGDSFSSGEANPPWDKGTNQFRFGKRRNGCHRSGRAWPRQIGVIQDRHFACSGAIIDDLYDAQEETGPDSIGGQKDRLAESTRSNPVSLAFVTLGGNDAGFAEVLGKCRVPRRGGCLQRMEQVEVPKIEALESRLTHAYEDVRSASGGARVVVVGYPDIFPSPREAWTRCNWMNDGEKRRVTRFADVLDSTIANAARKAGVEFVSVRNVLDGHELCTPKAWVFPISSLGSGDLASIPKDQRQAHPTRLGQRAIASAVQAYLTRHSGTPEQGVWRGAVVGDNTDYSVVMALSGELAAPGQRVGSTDYPELRCGGTLYLVSRDGARTVMEERIIYGANRCIPTVKVTLVRGSTEGQALVEYAPDDGRRGIRASVSREAVMPDLTDRVDPGEAGTWRGAVEGDSSAYTVQMQLTSGHAVAGQIVGANDYPELSCGGPVSYVGRTYGRLVLKEQINRGQASCVLTGEVTFTVGEPMGLWTYYGSTNRLLTAAVRRQ